MAYLVSCCHNPTSTQPNLTKLSFVCSNLPTTNPPPPHHNSTIFPHNFVNQIQVQQININKKILGLEKKAGLK